MQNNPLKDQRPRKSVELNFGFCTLANRLSHEKTKTIFKKEKDGGLKPTHRWT
jgi:hypothetical protein